MEYATAALSVLKFLFDLSVADLGAPQWVEGKGEYAITREISEREACARSEKQAKLNALRKAGGERISSDTLMSCTDEDCPITQFTWNAFDGLIKDIKDKTVTVEGSVCYTVLQAYVDNGQGESDPDFDLAVHMDRVFEHGDYMEIKVQTTQTMYVNIFNWNPYAKKDKQVVRVFPNTYEPSYRIASEKIIPSGKYHLRVDHPNVEGDASEYLHVLATRKPIRFLDTYALEKFHARVLEIPKQDRRYIRKPYRIVR
tara:strand:+ start:237 stop:1004 length:768 start_codon:yes stop_codon:yes gene_type:complete